MFDPIPDETPYPDRDFSDPATEIFNLAFPPYPGGGCPECGGRNLVTRIGTGDDAEIWAGCTTHLLKWVDKSGRNEALQLDELNEIAANEIWAQLDAYRHVEPLMPRVLTEPLKPPAVRP